MPAMEISAAENHAGDPLTAFGFVDLTASLVPRPSMRRGSVHGHVVGERERRALAEEMRRGVRRGN